NSSHEIRYSKAHPSELSFSVIQPREKKHEYTVEDGGDRWFILSNYKAKNFRLFETTKDKPQKKYWREVVPHREDTLLEDVLVLKDFIVLEERKKGLTQLTYFSRGTKRRKTLEFPDPTYVAGIGVNAEYASAYFRYDYQSLTQP